MVCGIGSGRFRWLVVVVRLGWAVLGLGGGGLNGQLWE